MNKKEQTINTYNETASRMAKKFRDIGARISDIENGFSLVHKDNPKVLEIGCGDGRDAKEIIKRTDDYQGMDVSEEMIRVAKDFVTDGNFVVADIDTFEFPKNLDIIFSFASLLHSKKESISNILRRAKSSLNKNGIFYISLKYSDEYSETTKTDEFGTRTYFLYNPEIIKTLAGSDYEVVSQDTQELRGQKWFTIILKKL